MATEKGAKAAAALWAQVTSFLDSINLKYEVKYAPDEDNDYMLSMNCRGDDLPMVFFIQIDAARQILCMRSLELVKFNSEQLPDAAQAVCAINDQIFDGQYALDLRDGTVLFTYTVPFAGSLISEAVLFQMFQVCTSTVDEYNDKLFALQNGFTDLDGFLKAIDY